MNFSGWRRTLVLPVTCSSGKMLADIIWCQAPPRCTGTRFRFENELIVRQKPCYRPLMVKLAGVFAPKIRGPKVINFNCRQSADLWVESQPDKCKIFRAMQRGDAIPYV
jgi:hypothetical protein